MKEVIVPSQTQPRLNPPQGTVSRDSAAMEEACALATSTHLGCIAAESGILQSENTTSNYYMYRYFPEMQANQPPPGKCTLNVGNVPDEDDWCC